MMNSQQLQPPIPTARDFGPLLQLLGMIADPSAHKDRLDKLASASLAAQAVIDQSIQAQKDMVAARASHDQALLQERAAHNAALLDEKTRFEVDCERRANDLTERERKLAGLEVSAKADADRAAKLRLDLENRLARMAALAT